jgi:hypothetical protein
MCVCVCVCVHIHTFTHAHKCVYRSTKGEGKTTENTTDKVRKVKIRLVDEDGNAWTQWSMPFGIDEIRSVPLRLLHSSSNLADAVAEAPVLKCQYLGLFCVHTRSTLPLY